MTRRVVCYLLFGMLCQATGILGQTVTTPNEKEVNLATQPGANDLIKVGTDIVVDIPVAMGSAIGTPLDTVIILDPLVDVLNGLPPLTETFPQHPVVPLDQAAAVSKEVIMRLLAEEPIQGDVNTQGEIGIGERMVTGRSEPNVNTQWMVGNREATHDKPVMPMAGTAGDLSFLPMAQQVHDFPAVISEVPIMKFPFVNLIPPKFPLHPLLAPLMPKMPPPLPPPMILPAQVLPKVHPPSVLPKNLPVPVIPKFQFPQVLPKIISPKLPSSHLPPTVKIPFRPSKIRLQVKSGPTKFPVRIVPTKPATTVPANPIKKSSVKKTLPAKPMLPKPKLQSIVKKTSTVQQAKHVIPAIPNKPATTLDQQKRMLAATKFTGSQKKFVAVQTTLSTIDRLRGVLPTSTDSSIQHMGHPQFTRTTRGNRTLPDRPPVQFLGQNPSRFINAEHSNIIDGVGTFTHASGNQQHGFGNKQNAFNLDLSQQSLMDTLSFLGSSQKQQQHTLTNPVTDKAMSDNHGYGALQGNIDIHLQPVAERVLQDMDLTVNPCDNFYRFACGGYIKNSVNTNGILAKSNEAASNVMRVVKAALEEPSTTDEPEPLTKAKVLYNSCMHEGAIEASGFNEIYSFMSELGGWPVLGNWDDFNFDFVELLAKPRPYIKDYGFHHQPTGVIIGTVIQRDFKTPDSYALYIDQPSLGLTGFGGLPNRELYLSGNNNIYIEAYKQYATDIAIALGADPETASREMCDIVDFETSLARIMLCEEERRLAEVRYQKFSIIDLTMRYPGFEWLRYLQTIVKLSNARITVTPTDPVILWAMPYYDRLFSLLKTVQHRTLANYVVWRALQPLLPAMNRQFRQLTAQYVSTINGATQVAMPPRNDFCTQVVITNMRWVASRVYVDRSFGPEALAKVLEISEYVKQIHIEQIQRSEWLDDLTKSALLVKLRTLTDDIAFPLFLTNNKYLVDFYHDHHFTLDSFFENMKRALTQNYARQLQQLAYPQLDRWILSPVEVNALHNLGTSSIELPAAIIQEPFFSLDYPLSMNVGGIGWLIGHEQGHGFDVTGAKFDSNGLINKIWTDASFQNFARRADCFVRQYSDYYLPEGNLRISNGNKTLNENLCDFIGHKAAFHAYQRMKADRRLELNEQVIPQFTGDQLYFINSARMFCSNMSPTFLRKIPYLAHHSVDRIRIIGAMQNLPEFSRTFACPAASPMNPMEKCEFW